MIYYKQESYGIIGAAMHVYNTLGHGFLEAVYQEALELELKNQNIPYEREKLLPITYKGKLLEKDYYADFICYGKIVVELKAVAALTSSHKAQVINYLKASSNEIGLLIYFGTNSLKWERISKIEK